MFEHDPRIPREDRRVPLAPKVPLRRGFFRAPRLRPPLPSTIPVAKSVPAGVSASEMRHLDQWVVREYQRPLIVTIELGGRALAELLRRRFKTKRGDPIVVLAGRGTNGAIALAGARHLLHRGHTVHAITTEVHTKFKDEPMRSLAEYRKEGGHAPPWTSEKTIPPAKVIVDGLLGYALAESSKGPAGEMIAAANEADAHRVALEIPSGVHPDTGKPDDPAFRADATLMLALPKAAALEAAAKKHVGELYLADVQFPRPLYDDFDTTPEALFGDDTLVRLP